MPTTTVDARSLSLLGALFVAFLCAVFGANTVAIKFSLNGLGVFTTAALRFGLASCVIFIWTTLTRQPIAIQKGQLSKLLIITAIFFVQLSLFYLGISKTLASRGTLLANIQPFFVLFLAHFFIVNDRITKQKLVGMLLGFSGVAFVFLERSPIAPDLKTGDVMILIAAFIWACNGVYTKQILKDLNPLQVVAYPALFSAPLFMSVALMTGELNQIQLDVTVVLAVIYQGLIATAFGFVAWNTMLRQYGAVAMHSFIFIMPIAGVALGGLLLNEPITTNIVIALLLIALGIFVVNTNTRKAFSIVYPGRNV